MMWIKFLTWFKGTFVGQDRYGNRYYHIKGNKERRWVMYKGIPEASKVPAEWHGWLHHQCQDPPTPETTKRWAWEKKHLPNLSGTAYAYHPRETVQPPGSYEAWKPSKVKDENKSS